MVFISQEIKKDMEKMNLLKPEVVRNGNGDTIWYKEEETSKYKKSVNKKVHIASGNKNSKGKSYYVEEPIYKKYLFLKSKQTK